MEFLVVAAIVLVMIAFVVVAAVKSLIVICPPNKVAVISGRDRILPDGRKVGYRTIKGGRDFRKPIIIKNRRYAFF